MNWTKPYHGVSHCLDVHRPFQATIEVYGTFVDASWFSLNSLHPFTPETKTFRGESAIADAKAWLEKKAHLHEDDYR